ncbi:nuclear transport factor 2 family protein [Dyella sp. 2HG41-7]|uniref:nuclear transport factor 2 family protein n=1 Tax=Dyella sp. 2HG41-7 TaxID=2883239 RepID=UPI001F32ACE6|nr:nuclear transport factor 2 family protein [Dyella sp. 2HG41-7]
MNLRTVVMATAVMGCLGSSCYAADQDAQVLEPVHRFFDAFGKQDKAGMLAVVAPNIEITSVQQNALHRVSMDKLATNIAAHKGGAIAEHIYQPIVHVDNDLAVVWAPYKFTVDGKVQHCGTDVFTLGKIADRWTIIGVSDNERKGNCQ